MGNFARRITAAAVDSHGITSVSQPTSWLVEQLGGGPTASGIRITPETAMRSITVWRCVSLLSWILAYLPIKVYRAREEGGADVERKHPNYRLLAQAPNAWQTSFQRRQYAGQSLLTRGNSYEVIERGEGGQVLSLIPQHPSRVQVFVDSEGLPIYQVTLFPSSMSVWFSRYEMHHNWLVSGNGYTGLSPVEMCKEGIGFGLATEEYGSRVLAGGGMVSGVLEIPPSMPPEAEAKMKASWEETHSRTVSNVGKVAILKQGAKFTPVGLKSTDAQWIESRHLSIEETCRIWGVPPALAGHTAPASSWGTGEIARYMGFLATTVDPMLIAIEQALQRDLFLPEEFDLVYPQYVRAALLATDLLTRYRSYAIGRQWGWLTVNKILSLEDMNPVGKEGDVLLDPINMARIPVDPTAVLDAGRNGGDGQSADLHPLVRAFLERTLTGGRETAQGA
jgi:HK97 family phage portal protein